MQLPKLIDFSAQVKYEAASMCVNLQSPPLCQIHEEIVSGEGISVECVPAVVMCIPP